MEKKDLDESMEETLKVDQEMPLVDVKSELEEGPDSHSESEREESGLKSPRVSTKSGFVWLILSTVLNVYYGHLQIDTEVLQ